MIAVLFYVVLWILRQEGVLHWSTMACWVCLQLQRVRGMKMAGTLLTLSLSSAIYRRDTDRTAHSVSFVWTLCVVRNILFQTFMKNLLIFLFLDITWGETLQPLWYAPSPIWLDTNEKKTGFHGLSQARVQAKQLFDFSFTSRWGGHQICIFTLIWHGLNYMPSSVITLAFQYSRDMLSLQILIGNSGPKVQWWINHSKPLFRTVHEPKKHLRKNPPTPQWQQVPQVLMCTSGITVPRDTA